MEGKTSPQQLRIIITLTVVRAPAGFYRPSSHSGLETSSSHRELETASSHKGLETQSSHRELETSSSHRGLEGRSELLGAHRDVQQFDPTQC